MKNNLVCFHKFLFETHFYWTLTVLHLTYFSDRSIRINNLYTKYFVFFNIYNKIKKEPLFCKHK